jgi:glyoxylase-like metal-dependent hydrolase (beta-lactamase superfamily II)
MSKAINSGPKGTVQFSRIYRQTYRIEGNLGGKPLYLYFFDGKVKLLLDTGVKNSPNELIVPFLKSIGEKASSIAIAINTHADSDHFGGNSQLKRLSPSTILAAHVNDRILIEDPERIISERYNMFSKEHGIHMTPNAQKNTRAMMGSYQELDLLLQDGEIIRVDTGLQLKVLHVPGHSHGHLALYDAAKNILFIGDAVLWKYIPDSDGKPILAPTYIFFDDYLRTIRKMKKLRPNAIYSAHFPAKKGDDAIRFLDESEKFALKLKEDLVDTITGARSPLSLMKLVDLIFEKYGFYPESTKMDLAYPIWGTLDNLIKTGTIRIKWSEGKMVYSKT